MILNPYRFGNPAFSPDDLASLSLWLDASDSSTITTTGGGISTWADKSSAGNDATQSINAKRPVVISSALNSLDVVEFDGSDDVLDVPDISTVNSDYTIVGVLKIDLGGTDNQNGFGADPNQLQSLRRVAVDTHRIYTGAASLLGGTWADDVWIIRVDILESVDNASMRVDGTNETLSATTFAQRTLEVPNIGASSIETAHFDGRFAEILVYTDSLSLSDTEKVEGYLAHKWGLTGNLPGGHPYKSVAP